MRVESEAVNLHIQYQYQDQLTGVVKAYKAMTLEEAGAFNCILESQDAHGRWVPHSAFIEAEREVIYGLVEGPADGRYDAAG